MAARHRIVPVAIALAFLRAFAGSASAGDWPMWRHDAVHSAAATESLPDTLRLKWTRQYSARIPVWDDPLNQDLMPYDRIFEPVVLGHRMFLGFNDSDKLVALDTRTGRVVWTFYSDGPIRFSPVAADGKVYFTSDDGCLYCVDAGSGKLRWKLRGGPSARKVLGNRRLISAWPARGGPVLRDRTVYFAASIWPFIGTFLYAVDAESGKVRWVNDSTGADYIKQPHDAPAFAGVAPQGQLTATERLLLVPGGRSCPAAFDRATGRLVYFQFGKKGDGGSFVAADESRLFVHTRLRGTAALQLSDGRDAKLRVNEPVLADGMVYAPNTPGKVKDPVVPPDQADDEERKPAAPAKDPYPVATPTVQVFDAERKLRWQIEADGSGDLIKAGRRLYAAGAEVIVAIDVPTETAKARIAWSIPVRGKVMRLLAADNMLFAVTLDGRIMAFSAERTAASQLADTPTSSAIAAAAAEEAEQLLKLSGKDGYALWFGVDDGTLLEAVVGRSSLKVVAVDPDPDKVQLLRARFDAAGWYGKRVTVHEGDPVGFQAPPYIAQLVVAGRSLAGQMADQKIAKQIYESVRPYGGKLCILASKDECQAISTAVREANLAKAAIAAIDAGVLVTRQGPLPGAADWTHAYGDIANTVKSNDQLVKAPLGLLWFGGSSNLDVLPRHGHGPSEQVIDGRLFIEGINALSARDVYTGRELWTRRFPDLGAFNVYYDSSYADTPLSTAYNQKHLPGVNQRGTNFVATHEGVYLVAGSTCVLLDTATGATIREFKLPAEHGQPEPPAWGFVGVYDHLLLAGVGFADYTQRLGYQERVEKDPKKKDSKSTKPRGPAWGPDKSASLGLLAFDRHSGRVLWKVDAIHSFLHNGIVAGEGRIYCLDRLPKRVEEHNKRRGVTNPKSYRVVALNVASGKALWSRQENIVGTWLSYSQPRDILLLAGSAATDRSPDEATTGMAAYRGRDGSLVWENRQVVYSGPCMIHHDTIITNVTSYKKSAGAFNLLDGKPATVVNPLTGESEPWSFTRSYGCNTAVACENLLTFRSGAAGYYDLTSHGGTGNLGGFKSGCTSNLIAANGVLNAPDFTRTCTCPYQNQTSLALIPMPELETWAYSLIAGTEKRATDIRRVGINLGAPGDRRADDGTLWLEYPSVGGMSPKVAVEVEGSPTWFRRHSARVAGEGLAWVAASGVEGAERIVVHLRPSDPKSASRPSPRPYTVRLYFLEPDEKIQPGQRVFDVTLQGKPVLERFDIVNQAHGPWRSVVRTFEHQPVVDDLIVTLRPTTSRAAILCGIEAVAE